MPGEFTAAELREMLARAEAEANSVPAPSQINVRTTASLPDAVPEPESADRYAPEVWGASEYDFTVPSGQRCRMRRIPEIELLSAGILDRVSRLPGLTQGLIDRAQGTPPNPELDLKLLSENEELIGQLAEVVDKVTVLAVIRPRVYLVPTDEERQPDRIYIDSIDLVDRMAITERALRGVKDLDSFRPGS